MTNDHLKNDVVTSPSFDFLLKGAQSLIWTISTILATQIYTFFLQLNFILPSQTHSLHKMVVPSCWLTINHLPFFPLFCVVG